MNTSNQSVGLVRKKKKPPCEPDDKDMQKILDIKDSGMPEENVAYREMFEVLPLPVFIHVNGRFVYVNQETVRLHGLECASQLVGRSLADFVYEDDLSVFRKNVLKHVENIDQKRQTKIRILQAKNKILDLDVTSVPIMFKGERARLATCLDITELRNVERELYRYQDQLRALTSRMTLTEEYERHQIAVNLHEQIGQALVVSKMKLGALRQAATTHEMIHALDEIRELISQIIQDTRSLTFELSPPVLHELGLKAGLEWLVEKFADQGTIRYTYEDKGNTIDLDSNIRVLLFRATRELLFNVQFHSNATHAGLLLSVDDRNIHIRVEDNGVGFDLAKIDEKVAELSGVGLFGIRERINHLGGRFEIESRLNRGTRVTIVSPKKYHRK